MYNNIPTFQVSTSNADSTFLQEELQFSDFLTEESLNLHSLEESGGSGCLYFTGNIDSSIYQGDDTVTTTALSASSFAHLDAYGGREGRDDTMSQSTAPGAVVATDEKPLPTTLAGDTADSGSTKRRRPSSPDELAHQQSQLAITRQDEQHRQRVGHESSCVRKKFCFRSLPAANSRLAASPKENAFRGGFVSSALNCATASIRNSSLNMSSASILPSFHYREYGKCSNEMAIPFGLSCNYTFLC